MMFFFFTNFKKEEKRGEGGCKKREADKQMTICNNEM